CSIAVTAGTHAVRIAFSWSTGSFMSETTLQPPGDREVAIDAVGGHIYRVKFDFSSERWARIVDVTSSEAGLPAFHAPGSSSIRKLPKAQRTATLVLRISPERSFLLKLRGATDGIWFREGFSSATLHRTLLRAAADGGYVLSSAEAGENFTLGYAM